MSDAGRFDGRTVLITGAAGGFGQAMASRFAAEGARLVLSDLDADRLAAAFQTLDAEAVLETGDVTADDDARKLVETAVSRFGSLDVAINNAGIATRFKPLEETAVDEAERIIGVNLFGVINSMRHQLPQMQKQFAADNSRAAIVNIASIAGVIGASGLAVYAASKHGVVGLTKSAALENARRGIRVNAICPTFSPTAMVTDSIVKGGDSDEVERLAKGIPMRRLADVCDVVEAVVYAASPASGFLTGQTINVDGGITAG